MTRRRFNIVCFPVDAVGQAARQVPISVEATVEGGAVDVPPPPGVVFKRPAAAGLWPELKDPPRGDDEAL